MGIKREIWKWVVVYKKGKRISYKGYYKVSNLGRVKTETRTFLHPNRFGGFNNRTFTEKLLKQTPNNKGYPKCTLAKSRKRGDQFCVHKLVLWAFVGSCPTGMESRHLNDVKTDNYYPQNIRYGTHKQNCQDALQNGKILTKLSQSEVKRIRKLFQLGWSQTNLAKKFKVDQSNISYIVNKKSWKEQW